MWITGGIVILIAAGIGIYLALNSGDNDGKGEEPPAPPTQPPSGPYIPPPAVVQEPDKPAVVREPARPPPVKPTAKPPAKPVAKPPVSAKPAAKPAAVLAENIVRICARRNRIPDERPGREGFCRCASDKKWSSVENKCIARGIGEEPCGSAQEVLDKTGGVEMDGYKFYGWGLRKGKCCRRSDNKLCATPEEWEQPAAPVAAVPPAAPVAAFSA